VEDARAKVAVLVRAALLPPRRRVKTAPPASPRQRRLTGKKRRAAVKRWRARGLARAIELEADMVTAGGDPRSAFPQAAPRSAIVSAQTIPLRRFVSLAVHVGSEKPYEIVGDRQRNAGRGNGRAKQGAADEGHSLEVAPAHHISELADARGRPRRSEPNS